MKIMVVGNGGREHALVRKLAQEAGVKKVWAAPGNGGTPEHAENVLIAATDVFTLRAFAEKNRVDLTIVGPESALALGIVDAFQERRLPIFGPTQAATRIESSKSLAKRWMREEGVPTAEFDTYATYNGAMAHASWRPLPFVVKASMLAAGKGAFVCRTRDQAMLAIDDIATLYRECKRRDFCVVIEDYVPGEELSLFTLTDGKSSVLLEPAQDHKALYMNPDGTEGPNTGGMASHSPVAWATSGFMEERERTAIQPILARLAEKNSFTGCLYTGLKGGKVLEYNARFGDPETQPLLARLRSPLLPLLFACATATLDTVQAPVWDPRPCACLVVASKGYPGEYKKHLLIEGLAAARDVAPNIEITHAGTTLQGGRHYTNGGRVLGITVLADTLAQAYRYAELAAEQIRFDGSREQVYFRRDIKDIVASG